MVDKFLGETTHPLGGMDLEDIVWDQKCFTMKGTSRVVKNDPYEIVLYLPEGWRIDLDGNDITPADWKTEGTLCRLTVIPKETGEYRWGVQFAKL